jgi:hypothetical protein
MKHVLFIYFVVVSHVVFSQSIMNLHMNNGIIHQYSVNEIDSITYSVAVLPTVVTNNVSSTSINSTTASAEVTNNGGTTITNRGFCWSSSPNPNLSNNSINVGSGLGSFSSSIVGLNSNSTYFVRAFATNSMGTAYGNEISFNTTSGIITLSTVDVSPINATDAFINVLIADDEGVSPTTRGVCYSSSPNPTTANQVVNSGSGIGTFTKNINGLTSGTTYYVRAFATNSTGTYYGNELSFTTLIVSPSIGTTGPGGGKIFYDKGYVSNGWQYLEVMTSMATGNTPWSPNPLQIVNTPASLVGEGDINMTNTTNIYGSGSYAASACSNSTMGSVSDWYLPNVNEWLVMRQNIGPLLSFTGNFYYWSSEEIDANNAILMIENLDYITTQISLPKSDAGRCRCIRKF